MKQYNRIMLGEHGKYVQECIDGNFIGANFLKDYNLSDTPFNDEREWRRRMVELYLQVRPDRSRGSATNAIGFLWTICFGLHIGDIVLASNGNGGYLVGEIESDYYYEHSNSLSHRRKVRWLGKTILRGQMSTSLKNSSGSIGTCCNITKYAEEIETLITGVASTTSTGSPQPVQPRISYKERSLHRLLCNYLISEDILSKTIFHENSNRVDAMQKWAHPDMVGVRFVEFQDSATQALLKAAETKDYIELSSYELKRTIDNDHQLKEYFFQALSNSSWANYGYLVAFDISDDLMEEVERLNRSFGIGIIKLSPYPDDTKILYPARKNELDYYTIDKLCRINPDFKQFIQKTTKVLNAQDNYITDVKDSLQHFCDKGFASVEEIEHYCEENHIPC